jgi:hypothetical protein
MRQRIDLYFKPGPAQLPEKRLEALADDVIGQGMILRGRKLCILLGQSEKLDGLVSAAVSYAMSGLQCSAPRPPRECGDMAECLVSEYASIRDGVAAGLPGTKVFCAPQQPPARPYTRDHSAP